MKRMDELKEYSLDELIERVIRERLIDACERREDRIIIVQGVTRFVLSPPRAHAFLRGVIKGMSSQFRDGRLAGGRRDRPQGDGRPSEDDPYLHGDQPKLLNSFRRHLLRKWWDRYHENGCPLGQTTTALMLWIRYNTGTTVN